MARLSVVVPVYNVETYLDACLESLEAQTFSDFEVVCVNDGSTDRSPEMLAGWAARDARIKVVTQENRGLPAARNAGMGAATGDYVCFLDSDDRFHENACADIVRLMDETGADVLTFGATLNVPEGESPEDRRYAWARQALSPRDVVYDHFDMDVLFRENSRPFAWRTACRADFLRDKGIAFDEGVPFGEDQVFDFAIYPRARRIALSSEKLYDYRVDRPGSLMDRMLADKPRMMLEHVKILAAILTDWKAGGFIDGTCGYMVGFGVSFVMYEALEFDDADYRRVASALRQVLSTYWTREDVERANNISDLDRHIALQAVYDPELGRRGRDRLQVERRRAEAGRKSAFRLWVKLLLKRVARRP